jgi:hypothetical protein
VPDGAVHCFSVVSSSDYRAYVTAPAVLTVLRPFDGPCPNVNAAVLGGQLWSDHYRDF